jgi:hypothetical protein
MAPGAGRAAALHRCADSMRVFVLWGASSIELAERSSGPGKLLPPSAGLASAGQTGGRRRLKVFADAGGELADAGVGF